MLLEAFGEAFERRQKLAELQLKKALQKAAFVGEEQNEGGSPEPWDLQKVPHELATRTPMEFLELK